MTTIGCCDTVTLPAPVMVMELPPTSFTTTSVENEPTVCVDVRPVDGEDVAGGRAADQHDPGVRVEWACRRPS